MFSASSRPSPSLIPLGSFRLRLVFRLIHLHPALTMAMAFLARRCEARMGLALAVHVKGFGFWLRCSIHSSIAASRSATLLLDSNVCDRTLAPSNTRRDNASLEDARSVARRLCALRFIETFDDAISLQPG